MPWPRASIIQPLRVWLRVAVLTLALFPRPGVAQTPAVPRSAPSGIWPRLTIEPALVREVGTSPIPSARWG
jgi:hypothetical protein